VDGALQLINAGALSGDPRPELIFDAHFVTQLETGQIGYRVGDLVAGGDEIDITVHGRQVVAERPWDGVDALVVGSTSVLGLQTIASCQLDLTRSPAVLSVTEMHGGQYDSIAESLRMSVVLVWYGRDARSDTINRVKRTAANIASSAGATADANVVEEWYVPSVYNDPNLTARMRPTLERVAGKNNLLELAPQRIGVADVFRRLRFLPGENTRSLRGARRARPWRRILPQPFAEVPYR
jgi:metal-dependent amidase/aminoacylase/carboxypeptidase family protein